MLVAAGLVACSGAANKDLFSEGPRGVDRGDPGGGCPTCGDPNGGGLVIGKDAGRRGPDGGLLSGEDGSVVGFDASSCTPASAKRPPAYMLIVLDGSGSMDTDNKWTSVVPALDAVFDELAQNPDPTLGVGLMVFSDNLDPTQGMGPYPTARDVSVAFVDPAQRSALRARIDPARPSTATPTLAALSGGYKMLENFVVPPNLPSGGKKVLVLMTDGVPNGGGPEQVQCIGAASAELGKGITSFAVGIGPFPSSDTTTYDAAFMGKLAQAGGAAPPGCNPAETQNIADVCHFQITPSGATPGQLKQHFIEAINRIREEVGSCDFGISGMVDPSHFNVVFKSGTGQDTIVPENPLNGWTFDNPLHPTKVALHGTSCESAKLDRKGSVSFLTGCPTAH